MNFYHRVLAIDSVPTQAISKIMEYVVSKDPNHPANYICELGRLFYHNNWCTGTAGGISICRDGIVYVTPSGVEKEKLAPTDLFVLDREDGVAKTSHEELYRGVVYLYKPSHLRASACQPLFLSCYQLWPQTGAVVHTHSQNAVLVSLLYKDHFEISHMEQIKAIPNHSYNDTLQIPIVENMPHEDELTPTFWNLRNKDVCAVIVRRHGIFVWGSNVQKAKIIHEALDYLMELAVKMHQLGIATT